ncbi:MAG TPA: DUF2127 domain-containing protein [Pseudomonadales bacterium]|nr:DUF2127 domain-containing protein [Pseudomonadales bacterium]
MDAEPQKPAATNRAPTLYFIAVCKLAKGMCLLLLAAGIYSLAGKDLQDDFDKFLEWVRVDPEHSFFHNIGQSLAYATPDGVRDTAVALFSYGIFLLVGGTGLILRAKWAIWLTIGESGFFIPIEIFELVRPPRVRLPAGAPEPPHLFAHPKIGLLIVLTLNIFIVWYLLKNRKRLFKHHDSEAEPPQVVDK